MVRRRLAVQLVAGSPQLVVGAGTVPAIAVAGRYGSPNAARARSTCCPSKPPRPTVHVVVVILRDQAVVARAGIRRIRRHQVQRSAHRHLHGGADVLGDDAERDEHDARPDEDSDDDGRPTLDRHPVEQAPDEEHQGVEEADRRHQQAEEAGEPQWSCARREHQAPEVGQQPPRRVAARPVSLLADEHRALSPPCR